MSSRFLVVAGATMTALGGALYFRNCVTTQESKRAVKAKHCYVEIPSIITNLVADQPGFIKIKVVLEVPNEEYANMVHDIVPNIKDLVYSILHGMHLSEILAPDGLEQLKQQIKNSLSNMSELEAPIVRVLIAEYEYYQAV
jgi:flagellar basal body-associated protein FliL